ncbi:MAG: Crp/Fnr family transcriptional regulator [Spirochaetia bacterium]|nr:Crp/Fnr family transcriptional regulator [Spirochaetia bacterium]
MSNNIVDCNLLVHCPLFQGLSIDRLNSLLSPRFCRTVFYLAGERILTQGTKYDELYVLLEGKAAARFYEYSGKTVLVETLEAPAPAAAAILFSSDPYLPVTLEADSDVKVAIITRAGITRIFQAEPQVLERYLRETGDKVSFLAEKVRLAELAGIRQRFADYILRLRSRFHTNDLILTLSREKLAEMFGSARPSVSREISRMCDEGLISVSGKAVTILQPEKLKNLLEL